MPESKRIMTGVPMAASCAQPNAYSSPNGAYGYGQPPVVDYAYGDDGSDSDSDDDSPGGPYGYGGAGGIYGTGGAGGAKLGAGYGYGDTYKGAGGGGYGYDEDTDAGNPAGEYGYGDEATPEPKLSETQPGPVRQRSMRRNSCLIHKDQNPLAVAEYLLGGPPPMSDRDMDELEFKADA
jgi:hypothetical protein